MRKIFPVEHPVIGRSMAHLDLKGSLPRRAGWPCRGLLGWCLWIHKALSKAAFSLFVRPLLKRCKGLLPATVKPLSRELMARMFHTTGKGQLAEASHGELWQTVKG